MKYLWVRNYEGGMDIKTNPFVMLAKGRPIVFEHTEEDFKEIAKSQEYYVKFNVIFDADNYEKGLTIFENPFKEYYARKPIYIWKLSDEEFEFMKRYYANQL